MKSAVTISLVPEARGGPFVFWDDLAAGCRKAAAARASTRSRSSRPARTRSTPASCATLLDDNGLALAAVGTGAGWVKHKLTLTSPDEAIRDKAVAFVERSSTSPARSSAGDHRLDAGAAATAAVTKPVALRYLGNALFKLDEHAATSACRCSTSRSTATRRTWSTRSTTGVAAARRAAHAEREAAGRPVPHEHRGSEPRRRAPAAPGRTSGTSTSSTRTAAPPGWGTPTSRRSSRRCARSATRATCRPRCCRCPDSDAAAKQTIESVPARYLKESAVARFTGQTGLETRSPPGEIMGLHRRAGLNCRLNSRSRPSPRR